MNQSRGAIIDSRVSRKWLEMIVLALFALSPDFLVPSRSWADAAPPMPTPPPIDSSNGSLSPAAVGWGNLLVPGLGATLRGLPAQGLLEASLELATFYGGTINSREGAFTIDGSVNVPTSNNLLAPLTGQVLQEFGLKLHFYDTFYNYQQTALAMKDSEREKSNPQPLYTGTWKDELAAPFRLDYLSSPWVYPAIAVSSAYLFYSYATTPVKPLGFRVGRGEDTFYGITQTAVIPFGGALGEEALFRGFIQREMRLYTHSAVLALLTQTALFTLIHPNELKSAAVLGGLYFGIMVNHFDGNLEQAIATHFWVNVADGVVTYFLYKRLQGKDTPFAPPVTAQISIPF